MKVILIYFLGILSLCAEPLGIKVTALDLFPTEEEIVDKGELSDEKVIIADSVKRGLIFLSLGEYKKAEQSFKEGADGEVTSALFSLGAFYELGYIDENGMQVKPDFIKAKKFYELAAEKGHIFAKCHLGSLLLKFREREEGAGLLEQVAREGHVNGMNYLGDLYLRGKLLEQDIDNAVSWYIQAHSQGSMKAAMKLGDLYSAKWHGSNVKEALKWYEKAASGGETQGHLAMSKMFLNGKERDLEKAATCMEKAIESGDDRMYYHLGVLKENIESIEVALPYYERAARFGHSLAQHRLGDLHANAINRPQNMEKALHYYRKASLQGLPVSMYKAACAVRDGNGVEKNTEEGIKLLRVSAQRGYMLAQFDLGKAYQRGDGVEVDFEQALRWFGHASKQGYAPAKFEIGKAIEEGEGVSEGEKNSYTHYLNAAQQGLPIACFKMAEFYLNGEVVEGDPVTAYAFLLAIKDRKPEVEKIFKTLQDSLNSWEKVAAKELVLNNFTTLTAAPKE